MGCEFVILKGYGHIIDYTLVKKMPNYTIFKQELKNTGYIFCNQGYLDCEGYMFIYKKADILCEIKVCNTTLFLPQKLNQYEDINVANILDKYAIIYESGLFIFGYNN